MYAQRSGVLQVRRYLIIEMFLEKGRSAVSGPGSASLSLSVLVILLFPYDTHCAICYFDAPQSWILLISVYCQLIRFLQHIQFESCKHAYINMSNRTSRSPLRISPAPFKPSRLSIPPSPFSPRTPLTPNLPPRNQSRQKDSAVYPQPAINAPPSPLSVSYTHL